MKSFVTALIVAAGGSTRMGTRKNKLLLDLKGMPVIARTLLAFESEDDQLQAAQLAVKQGLSVRELEKLAKKANAVLHGGDERAKRVKKRPVFIEEVELSLNEHLGRKVKIQEKGKEKGVLTIEFYSQEDLQNLARLLGGEE